MNSIRALILLFSLFPTISFACARLVDLAGDGNAPRVTRGLRERLQMPPAGEEIEAFVAFNRFELLAAEGDIEAYQKGIHYLVSQLRALPGVRAERAGGDSAKVAWIRVTGPKKAIKYIVGGPAVIWAGLKKGRVSKIPLSSLGIDSIPEEKTTRFLRHRLQNTPPDEVQTVRVMFRLVLPGKLKDTDREIFQEIAETELRLRWNIQATGADAVPEGGFNNLFGHYKIMGTAAQILHVLQMDLVKKAAEYHLSEQTVREARQGIAPLREHLGKGAFAYGVSKTGGLMVTVFGDESGDYRKVKWMEGFEDKTVEVHHRDVDSEYVRNPKRSLAIFNMLKKKQDLIENISEIRYEPNGIDGLGPDVIIEVPRREAQAVKAIAGLTIPLPKETAFEWTERNLSDLLSDFGVSNYEIEGLQIREADAYPGD